MERHGLRGRFLLGFVTFALIGLPAPSGAGAAADSRGTQLRDAAQHGDLATVKALAKTKADVNAADLEGATAAHWAAQRDDLAMMDVLIAAGANVKAANHLGVTPINLAAVNGNPAMLGKLLSAGADLWAPVAEGETPVMTAARTGRADAVRLLLDWGADANATENSRGQTALMWAASDRHPEATQVLLDYGADVNAKSWAGYDALFFAVRAGDIPSVQVLLKSGARVDSRTQDGTSPLVVAIVNAHWELAAWLLDKGASPDEGAPGGSPLHTAVRTRNPETVATPDAIPTGDLSSLDFIKALIARGANVNAQLARGNSTFLSLSGATPLLLAAYAVDVPLIRLLIDKGADPKIGNKDNSTVLMAAAGLGYDEGRQMRWTEPASLDAVKAMLDLGADPNAVDANGNTALHGAALTGANSVVNLLVEKGAKLDVKNKLGYLPVTIAEGINIGALMKFRPATGVLLRQLMEKKAAQP